MTKLDKNLECLMLIIGHRFPRFWFDLWVVSVNDPQNVKGMIIEIVDKCFKDFSVKEQLKIKEILKNMKEGQNVKY